LDFILFCHYLINKSNKKSNKNGPKERYESLNSSTTDEFQLLNSSVANEFLKIDFYGCGDIQEGNLGTTFSNIETKGRFIRRSNALKLKKILSFT
jgi:hypothetical protein